MTPPTPEELLRLARESLESAGILSAGPDRALSTEDYARLAEVNSDFEDELFTRLNEMTPQQACQLFDLARAGFEASAEIERLRDRFDLVVELCDDDPNFAYRDQVAKIAKEGP